MAEAIGLQVKGADMGADKIGPTIEMQGLTPWAGALKCIDGHKGSRVFQVWMEEREEDGTPIPGTGKWISTGALAGELESAVFRLCSEGWNDSAAAVEAAAAILGIMIPGMGIPPHL